MLLVMSIIQHIFLVLLLLFHYCDLGNAESKYAELCRKYPNSVWSQFNEQKQECSLGVRTPADLLLRPAKKVCQQLTPWPLTEVKTRRNGTLANTLPYELVCVYAIETQCNDDEYIMFDRCFKVATGSLTHDEAKQACKAKVAPKYELHKLQMATEHKWISRFFTDYTGFWTASDKLPQGRTKVDPSKRVLIRPKGNFLKKIRPGEYELADMGTKAHALCSRKAYHTQRTIDGVADALQRFQYFIFQSPDGSKVVASNNFYQPDLLNKAKDDPHVTVANFYEACQNLIPGVHAVPYFPSNSSDLRTFDDDGRRNLFQDMYVPAVTAEGFKGVSANLDCKSKVEKKDAEQIKKFCVYKSDDGTEGVIDDSVFTSNLDLLNQCADYPNTANSITMKEPYIRRIPPIARLPVLCSFGKSPELKEFDPNKACNKNAKFNPTSGQCECLADQTNPAISKLPDKDKYRFSGVGCKVCEGAAPKTAVFLVDDMGHTHKHANDQACRDSLNLIFDLFESTWLKDAYVGYTDSSFVYQNGARKDTCESSIPLKKYTAAEFRNEMEQGRLRSQKVLTDPHSTTDAAVEWAHKELKECKNCGEVKFKFIILIQREKRDDCGYRNDLRVKGLTIKARKDGLRVVLLYQEHLRSNDTLMALYREFVDNDESLIYATNFNDKLGRLRTVLEMAESICREDE